MLAAERGDRQTRADGDAARDNDHHLHDKRPSEEAPPDPDARNSVSELAFWT